VFFQSQQRSAETGMVREFSELEFDYILTHNIETFLRLLRLRPHIFIISWDYILFWRLNGLGYAASIKRGAWIGLSSRQMGGMICTLFVTMNANLIILHSFCTIVLQMHWCQ
jgi:hypothetical protein